MNKRLLHTLFFAVLACATLHTRPALAFFDYFQWVSWKKNMEKRIRDTFECLFPDEKERDLWKDQPEDTKSDPTATFIGDIDTNGSITWIPQWESNSKWNKRITIGYANNPVRVSKPYRQYNTIDELVDHLKSVESSFTNWERVDMGHNDIILIHELQTKNSTRRAERHTLLGNWLVSIEFEMKVDPSDDEQVKKWNAEKTAWEKRLKSMNFSQ